MKPGLGQEDNWVQKEWTVAERFAANVVWFRHEASLTQQELADRIGMNRTVLSVLERGRRLPRLDTILKLAAGLEVGSCDLLAWMWWRPAYHEHYETPPSCAATEGFDVQQSRDAEYWSNPQPASWYSGFPRTAYPAVQITKMQ